ncbi:MULTISPECIES: adenylyl-sulfate kinase [Pseudoalteromonas]|jgi:adenylylsulfate kinase|uniref:adenylyl-sulfate kinase n=1 Tax=Pseudoalteromonas TaxID=53246 RepID=UPI0002CAE772|nr:MULTISPECIES: adenylyl-sulfate kinase [Pseudoalteromonas]MCP4060271.1 adenylyl-sulfate kinase [Pseudoalteromonas sp.]ENO00797.1 adenylylsulfate kinase [Pseudoalteromonas agarivorans S816]MDI3244610.1 adenylyl-sulfate kinase [Pseudoalteromonas agarivorans]TMS64356.1 adenylyl-sulfate kinase [Pseudoalteromonas sp. S1691]TMS68240.1 adenylyl-sulfate kinase [Pseudoalteromonas sp. S1731]
MSQDENIVWHTQTVSRDQKQQHKGHKPALLWYTGLSGSGKSTVANAVEAKLFSLGCHTYLLDGDNVRMGLNKGLTFSDEDRVENIRRISEVAKLFVDAGLIVSTAFISPFKADRAQARSIVNEGEFIEVFIDTPLAICESRDPKGLYKKARAGEIPNFTGISSSFDVPENPDIHVHTAEQTIEQCADQIVDYLIKNKIVGTNS